LQCGDCTKSRQIPQTISGKAKELVAEIKLAWHSKYHYNNFQNICFQEIFMARLAKSAQTFLQTQARPLEQALYAYHFQSGSADAVLVELTKFQNDDGGFGNALEPDLRLPASSVIATTVALQTLTELNVDSGNLLVQAAIHYLLDNYDSKNKAWPISPPNTQDAPCAPWWDDPAGFNWLSNPRPEIVGYLFTYPDLDTTDLRNELIKPLVSLLESQPNEIEMHELLCYLRLFKTESLPQTLHDRMLLKLKSVLQATVAIDPADWEGYGLQPLAVVSNPNSPFAAMFSESLEQNLDFIINKQSENGAWLPPWSWEDRFPEEWEIAKIQWAGYITLNNLKTLRNFDRLE
jgi:hypothetical protein